MPLATISDLVNTLSEMQLLPPAQLEALATLQAQVVDPKSLARLLVQRSWLTPFQVNLLFQERGKELILGSYVLLEKINEGGMGVIYKAQHRHLKRIVALKVIRKERLEKPDIARRFFREIIAASQFDHPNIVRALDADQVDGTQFLVMEHIDGADLSLMVKQKGPLPVLEACEYIRQAALGLQHAFERGVVHRDIKPSNLLVARVKAPSAESPTPTPSATDSGKLGQASPAFGLVKVLDMGLARMQDPEATGGSVSTLTKEGMVMGTPDYIAPEQTLDSHHADTRADLYSLGCTFYFLLTGRPPFKGGTYGEKLLKHRFYPPEPVEALRPEVPPGLASIIRKLMAKRAQDRFTTPAEVAEVLAQGLRTGTWRELARIAPLTVKIAVLDAATGEGWSAIVNQPTRVPAASLVPAESPFAKYRRWLPWALAGGGFLALLLFLLLIYALTSSSTTPGFSGAITANRTWQDTYVDVASGDTLMLRISGTWKKGKSSCSGPGLADFGRERCLLPGAPAMCLLGRIDDQDPPMNLSNIPVIIQARRSGRLFLQANDLDLGQNSGQLQVRIEGGKVSSQPAKAPPPTAVQAADPKK